MFALFFTVVGAIVLFCLFCVLVRVVMFVVAACAYALAWVVGGVVVVSLLSGFVFALAAWQ